VWVSEAAVPNVESSYPFLSGTRHLDQHLFNLIRFPVCLAMEHGKFGLTDRQPFGFNM
jgi:hypothetical protein